MRQRRGLTLAGGVAVTALLVACVSTQSEAGSPADVTRTTSDPTERVTSAQVSPGTLESRRAITLVAAGDLCGDCTQTSRRARRQHPDVVLTVGDLAYSNGLRSEFRHGYAGGTTPPSRWGRRTLKRITLPGYGNHDCYDVPRSSGSTKRGCDDAVAYFGRDHRFGADIRGTPGSYHTVRNNWLIVQLNSAGDHGSGMATPREIRGQRAALRRVLAADHHRCEIVAWHHPRFSSGEHGNNTFVDSWFETAYAAGVDVVLTGHDHDYERFARQDGDGVRTRDGIIEFVVGTGGATTRPFGTRVRNSLVRIADTGILRMTLNDDGTYRFAFLDAGTGRVDDSGGARCHR